MRSELKRFALGALLIIGIPATFIGHDLLMQWIYCAPAARFYAKGDFKDAAREYDDYLGGNPEDYLARYELAVCLQKTGNWKDARAQFVLTNESAKSRPKGEDFSTEMECQTRIEEIDAATAPSKIGPGKVGVNSK
ncbi:MAG: tetratricopeptide repeat protein [Capsulimonadaceae bacterium]